MLDWYLALDRAYGREFDAFGGVVYGIDVDLGYLITYNIFFSDSQLSLNAIQAISVSGMRCMIEFCDLDNSQDYFQERCSLETNIIIHKKYSAPEGYLCYLMVYRQIHRS